MSVECWIAGSHTRIFPTANDRTRGEHRLDLARGENAAFQAVIGYAGPEDSAEVAVVCEGSSMLRVGIRRVGSVPVRHHNTEVPDDELDGKGHIPGYVPDPLLDGRKTRIARGEYVSFWIKVSIPRSTPPGIISLPVEFVAGGKTVKTSTVRIKVYDVTLPKRRGFPVTHWFYTDALLDWYGLDAFEPAFWDILKPYIKNCVQHGQDTLYVPVFTPPLDGVKRPTQLLRVSRASGDNDRRYKFDWTEVKRYIAMARQAGIRYFEWTHLFQQWGCEYALRVYEGQGRNERLLWRPNTRATSSTYRSFLREFLTELRHFLGREKLLEHSFFHVSDEPHGAQHLENYSKARDMLKHLAPWMKTMDALSEIAYGRQKATDMPIPSIRVTKAFRDEDIPCWTYFCCGPRGRYLNRLMDTPLIKIRMSGWLFYRFGVQGFLHWGYNYWYKRQTRTLIDPFTESAALYWPRWAYGDPFVVYPGEKGPIDSIRWEVFAASLQDYALLQAAGIDPADSLLEPFEDFDSFPKEESWLIAARRKVLARAAKSRARGGKKASVAAAGD
jgi:hypothetical protein